MDNLVHSSHFLPIYTRTPINSLKEERNTRMCEGPYLTGLATFKTVKNLLIFNKFRTQNSQKE